MSAFEFVPPDIDLVDRIRQGLRAHVSANTPADRLRHRFGAMSLSSILSSSTLELEPAPSQISTRGIPALRLVTSYNDPIAQNLNEFEAVS